MQTRYFYAAACMAMVSGPLWADTTTTYTYDSLGRVTQVARHFDGDTQQTVTLYDSTGNRASVTNLRTSKQGSGSSPVSTLLESWPLTGRASH